MKRLLLLLTFFVIVPFAHATTVHVDCSYTNANDGTDATCTGNTWTYPTTNTSYVYQTSQTGGPFTSGTTWYVSFTYSGTGKIFICLRGNCTGGQTFTSSQTAVPFTDTGASAWYYADNASGGTPHFVGTITDVCITSVSGDCEAGTPTPASAIIKSIFWWL